MNWWFDVPDSVGVWFGVRVMIQFLFWCVVFAAIVGNWNRSSDRLLVDVIAAISVVAVLVLSGAADELLSVFAFLFGINHSGW